MSHDLYKALYIHVPFCVSKCAYCDFDSEAVAADSSRITDYVEHIIAEIRRLSKEGELRAIETIYLGGGTPTHIGIKHIGSLLYALSVSVHMERVREFTVEANPESLTLSLVKDMWAMGVNRLSVGVQSFDNAILQTIGRAHTAEDAVRALDIAHERFENVSVDLMCGLPGQTRDVFVADVEKAVGAGVSHVSVYPLSLEKGTQLYKKRRAYALPDEDVQADMMEDAAAVLQAAGFERYEVASYARPGFESKHNTAYWSGVSYLGLGQSAVTMTQNANRRMRMRNGCVEDDLDAQEMAAEDAMLAMRMTRGLSKKRVARMQQVLPHLEATLRCLAKRGFVCETAEAWQPTALGWLHGNTLYSELLFCESDSAGR